MRTQLLCTFAHKNNLSIIIDYISKSYNLHRRKIFVFANEENETELFITYNIDAEIRERLPDTILIHRKKETNTLYTVNALNTIIVRSNNGILDKKFIINWEAYRNSLVLTNGDEIRHIHLRLFRKK